MRDTIPVHDVDSLATIIGKLEEGCGLQIRGRESPTSWDVSVFSGSVIQEINADRSKLHVIGLGRHPTFTKFSQTLEHEYMRDEADEIYVGYYVWMNMLWGFISVPLRFKQTCLACGEASGLRLCAGTPHVFPSGELLRQFINLAETPSVPGMDVKHFPLMHENVFTIESRGSAIIVVEGGRRTDPLTQLIKLMLG